MTKPDFQYDIKSSVVVFLVALPLCLGIALASGAPLASGLIAGVIGGTVVGFFSNSPISVSGPAAGLTVIVASGISQLGGFEKFGLAIVFAGIIQIIFGLMKGGAIGDYFPTAVIKGMLAAIGLILIFNQLPNALGLSKGDYSSPRIQWGIALISVISLTIMLSWEKLANKSNKFFKLIPSPLIAVVISIVLNEIFHLIDSSHLVKLPSAIFKDVRGPSFLDTSFDVLRVGFTIAVVASLETLLCIDAADKMDTSKRKTNKNTELVAQGIGNSLSGLLGGLPLTAVIVRTSANIAAGAKTKYSAFLHGCWLLLLVLFIPNLINLIPLATLASVLLLVGYKLSRPAFFVDMAKRGWDQLFIFCITIVAILATDLLKGILTGLMVAIIFELRKPSLTCFEVVQDNDNLHFKFTKNVSFLHKAAIVKQLQKVGGKKTIHFHGMKLVRVHVDIREMIMDYHEDAGENNLAVVFK
jgi:MFS superfamily sulfate permease-like transporter